MAEQTDVPSGGGGGGIISFSGTDWLGIGKTGSAAYQGTERCGSRPNCIAWTANCREQKAAFNDCVKRTTEQDYELAKMSLANESASLRSSLQGNNKIVIVIRSEERRVGKESRVQWEA